MRMTRASCVRVGPPLFALSVDRFFYVKVVPPSGGHEALQRDEAESVAKVVQNDDVGIDYAKQIMVRSGVSYPAHGRPHRHSEGVLLHVADVHDEKLARDLRDASVVTHEDDLRLRSQRQPTLNGIALNQSGMRFDEWPHAAEKRYQRPGSNTVTTLLNLGTPIKECPLGRGPRSNSRIDCRVGVLRHRRPSR